MLNATKQCLHKTFIGRWMILCGGNQLFAERFRKYLYQALFQSADILGCYFPASIHGRSDRRYFNRKQNWLKHGRPHHPVYGRKFFKLTIECCAKRFAKLCWIHRNGTIHEKVQMRPQQVQAIFRQKDAEFQFVVFVVQFLRNRFELSLIWMEWNDNRRILLDKLKSRGRISAKKNVKINTFLINMEAGLHWFTLTE